MKNIYDFSFAKRGAVAPTKGKRRITIMLNDAVIHAARGQANEKGIGYQTLITVYCATRWALPQRTAAPGFECRLSARSNQVEPSEC